MELSDTSDADTFLGYFQSTSFSKNWKSVVFCFLLKFDVVEGNIYTLYLVVVTIITVISSH